MAPSPPQNYRTGCPMDFMETGNITAEFSEPKMNALN
jgi:hypothetical protein